MSESSPATNESFIFWSASVGYGIGTGITYGLFTFVLTKILNVNSDGPFVVGLLILLIVTLGGMTGTLRNYSRRMHSKMSFGKAFGMLMVFSLVYAVVYVLSQCIVNNDWPNLLTIIIMFAFAIPPFTVLSLIVAGLRNWICINPELSYPSSASDILDEELTEQDK